MASIVEVCNLALDHLGQTVGITSLSEQSKAARTCSRHFQQALDEVMAAHPWPFATKAVALALVADDPLPGWKNHYAYPSDCLRAGRVCDEDGVRSQAQAWCQYPLEPRISLPFAPFVPFQLMSGETQTGIVTDLDEAWLIYTQRQENVTRLPPLALAALAWHLANKIAMPITSDPNMQNTALQMANIALVTAQAEGFNESAPDPDPLPPSIAVRG